MQDPSITNTTITSKEECPICMDEIDMSKNSLVTECGHKFHSSCLLQNIAHNGFDCPYCRNLMAQTPTCSESDSEDYMSDSDNDEDDSGSDSEEEDPREIIYPESHEDYIFGNFRWLFENTHIDSSATRNSHTDINDSEYSPIVPVAFILNKLRSKGYTMEHLLKCSLLALEEYNIEEYHELDGTIFNEIFHVLANYDESDEVAEVDDLDGVESSDNTVNMIVRNIITPLSPTENKHQLLNDISTILECRVY